MGVSQLGSLDPARASGPSSLSLLKAACEGVTALDPRSGRPGPAVARSWSLAPGAQKASLRLKEGLRFSDGTPVDAQAIRESLSRVARPATASPWSDLVAKIAGFEEVQSGAATHLSGVRILGSSRLEIELTQPFADLFTVLSHPGLTPVSLESLAPAASGPELPVCAGPYEIEETEAGKEYRLVRHGRPAEGEERARQRSAPGADVIVIKNYDTHSEAYAAFKAGEVDLAPVPETEIGEAQVHKGFERRAGPQVALLAFDPTKPPTDDARVRQAISLAVDRLVIIDAAFGDQRRPALRWLPESFGRQAGPACEGYIRKVTDSTRAKQRLDEAALEIKQPIPLIFDSAQFGRLVAQAIQVQVRDVLGIDLQPRPLDAPEFEASLEATPSPAIWLMSTNAYLPIPDELVGALFVRGSPKNPTGFSDAEVDAAVERARKAASPAEASRMWADAENVVCEKMPATPMWRASGQWIRHPQKIIVDADSMLDLSGDPLLRQMRSSVTVKSGQARSSPGPPA